MTIFTAAVLVGTTADAGRTKALPSVDDAVQAAHAAAIAQVGPASAKRTTMTLITAEPVTWPDAGLGCAPVGKTLPARPVKGYRVRIQVANDVWDYHASAAGEIVRCPVTERSRLLKPQSPT